MKPPTDSVLDRIIHRMGDHLDDAACTALMLDIDRETFLKAATKSFDMNKEWHLDLLKQAETQETS
jgi:hypothetical protein